MKSSPAPPWASGGTRSRRPPSSSRRRAPSARRARASRRRTSPRPRRAGRAVVARRPVGLVGEGGVARKLDLDPPRDLAVGVALVLRDDRRDAELGRPFARPGSARAGSRAWSCPARWPSALARYSASVEKPSGVTSRRGGSSRPSRGTRASPQVPAPRARGSQRPRSSVWLRRDGRVGRPRAGRSSTCTRTAVVPAGTSNGTIT